MNQRERTLAMGVGALAVVVGMFFTYSWISSGLAVRRGQIANLRQKLATQKKLVAETEAAKRMISDWERRSLPPQPTLASSLYGEWLLERVMDAKLATPKVMPNKPTAERELYNQLAFAVSGKGTLAQVVDLLHAFYSVDFLHRISRLSIVPAKEPKLLNFSMTVEALSMVGAPDAKQLVLRPGARLEKPDRDDYVSSIVNRNLFGPANQPPRLTGLGTARAETGSTYSVTAGVSDGDAVDKHSFKLDKSEVPDARLDSATGEFRFTPRRPGTYEFVISATDDGLPSKTATERLVVTVSDPVPPPAARAPTFDEARYTILAAVIDKDGTGEVWLHVRPRERNSMLKLSVGDSFEVGSVKGVVKSIGAADFIFETDGGLRELDSGESLDKATTAPQ